MVDLDSLTDEERNAYANLAQSLSPKSREALALHVSGWTRSNVEARRDWSHRWLVSGHWRNQWYPSEGVHRPIWIDAFVKGPSDAPLLVRPTVYRPHVPEEAS